MFTRSDVLSRPYYWLAEMRFELARAVDAYQITHGLSRSELARQLGCSVRYVADLPNGDANPSLEKLCRLSVALGKIPTVTFEALSTVLIRETMVLMPIRAGEWQRGFSCSGTVRMEKPSGTDS